MISDPRPVLASGPKLQSQAHVLVVVELCRVLGEEVYFPSLSLSF